MSSTSYAAWATFDVEKELDRVDEAEQREAQQKQQQQQIQAKERIESSATQAAQQAADILAAQAAVAALKAKKKTQKGRAWKQEVIDTEKAAQLQTHAKLFALKHELLLEILENRRLGERMMTGKNWHEAKRRFMTALAATKKLEELAPALVEVAREQAGKSDLQDKSPDKDCEPHKSCCSHGGKKPEDVLPKANDLVAIINMFYKDIYGGIGTCDLEKGRVAAATEAFKKVLLRDDTHLMAWFERGKAFEKMGAPLLAMLHYNRITNVVAEHEMGKEALERVKAKLLVEGDGANENDRIKRVVSACTEGRTFKEMLERIQWTFQEANVLAVESFFYYSTTQFQAVLQCLEAVRARPEVSLANEDEVSSVLRELEVSCHLNIASGCLEMQRNYAMGLTHCQQVLRLDSKCVVAYFRMGQLYHALHNYKKALECYEIARAMVPAIMSGQTKEQHKKMLITIARETDKCEFDRNQYDIEYLRSLAAKKSVDS